MGTLVELIKVIKSWFTHKSSVASLGDILSHEETKLEMLGMKKVVPPTHDRILQDANKIVNYSSKQDYQVWSQEAWAKVLAHVDALQDAKMSTDQMHFHRGCLRATLDLLRVAHQARLVKEQLEAETNVSSVR